MQRIIFLTLFFLSFVSLHADHELPKSEQICQGTLQNGMCYYLCPDFQDQDVKIAIVVKKSQQHLALPFAHSFFAGNDSDRLFSKSQSQSSPGSWFFEGTLFQSDYLLNGLKHWAKCLKGDVISSGFIVELGEEYIETVASSVQLEFYSFFYGDQQQYWDALFSGTDDAIIKAYQSVLDPSQICLIITGPFDQRIVQQELDSLFGYIPGNGTHFDPVKLHVAMPVAVTIREEDIDEEGEESVEEFSLYVYEIDPSFRNFVLNDLFLCTHFEKEFVVQNPDYFKFTHNSAAFPFLEKVPCSRVSESLFQQAKKELAEVYNEQTCSKSESCKRHFLFDLSEDVESWNQRLLRELENVKLEELNEFIYQKIQNIPISRLFTSTLE